jgi:hypothetical protein
MTLLLSLLLTTSAGLANDLNVAIVKQGRIVEIHYETNQDQTSMCEMMSYRVAMDSSVAVLPDERVLDGVLEIDTEVPAGIPCLMAIGPYSGVETFKLGKRYPMLKPGFYELWINGEDYGELNVKKNSVVLSP